MIDVTVHLVDGNVAVLTRDGELLERVLYIRDFFCVFERPFYQLVVVGSPVGVDRQARQYPMVFRWGFRGLELVEDCLR
jgi:hypothetical protein